MSKQPPPDLLTACKALMAVIDAIPDSMSTIEAVSCVADVCEAAEPVRAAIAKAEGNRLSARDVWRGVAAAIAKAEGSHA